MRRGLILCLAVLFLSVAACRHAGEPTTAAAIQTWQRSAVVCSRDNPPTLELSVSWSAGAGKALVSNPSAELCVGDAFPNAVSWTAVVPQDYEGEVQVTYKAAACSDSQASYLSVADNGSRRVRGASGAGVRAGACWGYDAKLHVAQGGQPVPGSPFTVDPEIIWKR